jgi:hypothetical protein
MRAALARPLIYAAIAGSLISVAGCGGTGSAPKPSASSGTTTPAAAASSPPAVAGGKPPAQAPPAGYQWVGSTAQRIWVAVPNRWIALDLSKVSGAVALQKLSFKGVPNATMRADIESFSKKHGLFAADVAAAASSSHKFASNANAFCQTTAIEPGPGAASELDSGFRAEYASLHLNVVSLTNTVVSTSEVIITTKLTAQTTAGFTLTEVQVADLTSQGRICYLTMTTDRPATYLATFSKIAATLHIG